MKHISVSLRPGYTAPFEEMLQRWRTVGSIVPNLTGLRFERQASRFRDEQATARPTGRSQCIVKSTVSDRVDEAVGIETVNSDSIPHRVKPKKKVSKASCLTLQCVKPPPRVVDSRQVVA